MRQHLQGDKELIGKLDSLKRTDAKAAIRKGTREGAKIVQAKAKELVPVRTGTLKRNIKVRALPRSRKWVGTMVKTTFANSEAFYGQFVEYGTRKMAARHFLKKAVNEQGDTALRRAADIIRVEVETRLAK